MTAQPPPAQMMQILMGSFSSAAVSAFARLGIADHLEDGPKEITELAERTNTRPDLLARLLRAVAGLGIATRTPQGLWQQNELSDLLRDRGSPTLAPVAAFFADDWHMRALGSLDQTVRTGEQAIDRIYGLPAFRYFEENPGQALSFNRAMTGFSSAEAPALVDACDFSDIRTIVDIGGGEGLLLATILRQNPDLQATLFDLPQVVSSARNGPLASVGDRARFVAGDMFQAVPGGSDTYVLKRILHDWPDEACAKILSACRAGVNDRGRLLVMDSVVPDDDSFSPSKFMDLMMMLFSGGRSGRRTNSANSLQRQAGASPELCGRRLRCASWRALPPEIPIGFIPGVPHNLRHGEASFPDGAYRLH
jgi:hypothetical protein